MSIGLPVYNGENYVAGAIESVLSQSWTDWELTICDNASVDDTEEIARHYSSVDERIHYRRNPENIGAAANFNRAFRESRGRYFSWLAHDDELEPDFIRSCIGALEAQPEAVLAFPWVTMIDDAGRAFDSWQLSFPVDSPEACKRFRAILLEWHNSFYIFGLMRSDVLRRTALIEPQAHGDTVLLARLSLMGPFSQITRHLFRSRKHDGQSNEIYVNHDLPRGLDLVAYSSWFGSSSSPPSTYPYHSLIGAYGHTLRNAGLSLSEYLGCWTAVAHLAWRYRGGLRSDLRSFASTFGRGSGRRTVRRVNESRPIDR